MTTLAAVQGDGWCVIGAESRATDEDGFPMDVSHVGKVFQSGPCLIAAAGSSRGCNILQFAWTAPAYGKSKSTDEYITKTLIPAMRKAFNEAGFETKPNESSAEVDNEFLVAIKGVIYNIEANYAWERCAVGIYTAGSGGKIALGALGALGADKAMNATRASAIVKKAIQVAIRWDVFSGGAIKTYTQEA
jgi:ATP-dependent protease HslVU (ClpYQ) peptidase subunit